MRSSMGWSNTSAINPTPSNLSIHLELRPLPAIPLDVRVSAKSRARKLPLRRGEKRRVAQQEEMGKMLSWWFLLSVLEADWGALGLAAVWPSTVFGRRNRHLVFRRLQVCEQPGWQTCRHDNRLQQCIAVQCSTVGNHIANAALARCSTRGRLPR